MDKNNILTNLRRIEASLSAIIKQIEDDNDGTKATIADVRKFAILDEVYQAGGKVTVNQISELAIKYGKTPGSCGGYYSGNSPSMIGKVDEKQIPESLLKPNWFTGEGRYLTNDGLRHVLEKREEWGNDWRERIPLDIVRSEVNTLTVINF